jgi:hypothetical protein
MRQRAYATVAQITTAFSIQLPVNVAVSRAAVSHVSVPLR